MKKILSLIIVLSLSISVITSCSFLSDYITFLGREARQLTDYSSITYERPDFVSLSSKIDTLKADLMLSEKEKYYYINLLSEIVSDFYYTAYTMESIAFLEYAKNIKNDTLREEYFYLVTENEKISAKLDELYYLCAASEYKAEMESSCLGVGFLDNYAGEEFTYPEEFSELLEKENMLINEYNAAMSELSVEYEGVTYTGETIGVIPDDELYDAVCRAYYDKYNSLLGNLYLELAGVRNTIAAYCGYTSYAEYSFDLYARDYSIGDFDEYFSGIKEYIAPVYRDMSVKYKEEVMLSLPEASPDEILGLGESMVSLMSPKLEKIFTSMKLNHLYTVACSEEMYNGSFQIYFNEYETPYLFVNGTGFACDSLTLMHEFGHFASAYYNYGNVGSNDEAEVASQGLELLSLKYLDKIFDADTAEIIGKYELLNLASAFTECAAYTEFENLVYGDDNLTVEKCNEYFQYCCDKYALEGITGNKTSDGMYWVFINHLFEYPYYMIGYSVSADTSVQLYEKCVDGIDEYINFIQLAGNGDFFGSIERSGLESPFAAGRAEKTAAFLRRELEKYS